MEDKLKKEIANLVDEIFTSKKEDEHRQKTKQALETAASSIEDLTTKVNDTEETIKSLESEKAELETQAVSAKEENDKEVVELKAELETAKEEATSTKTELDTVSAELNDLKQNAVATSRMAELEKAGVIRADVEAQTAKVKCMSEEEFASYQEELTSIRKSILDQLETAKEAEKAAKEKADKDGNSSEEGKENASEGEEEDSSTPAAEISPGKAIASALNLEIQPSDDLLAQYKAMGNAMAENMKEESK